MEWSKIVKRVFILILSAFMLLSAVFGLSACGVRKTSEVTPEPVATPEPEPAIVETDEPVDEAVVLPPKPEVDIYSWEFKLANSYNSIGEYRPSYATFEEQGINSRILQPAMDFLQAARNAGFNVWCSTALRNYEYLDYHFQSFRFSKAKDALDAANRMLGPGLNEHQTGLAIDFTDKMDLSAFYHEFEDDYMKDTELYQWLVEHCTEYGFVLRYPEGKEEFYGVACQHPAHFRYVGKEAAEYMTENNLCLEEFIMLYDESLVFLPKP